MTQPAILHPAKPGLIPSPGVPSRPIRIGIAGPPACGKTAIADMAARELSGTVLHLDDFFLPGHVKRKVTCPDGRNLVSYAHPDAYDGVALAESIGRIDAPVILAEGFLLYAYGNSGVTYDLRVFIRLDWETIEQRLAARSTETCRMVGDAYKALGRTEWEAFGAPQEMVADLILNGHAPLEHNAAQVVEWAGRVARLVDADLDL